jgi:hypothetical protein
MDVQEHNKLPGSNFGRTLAILSVFVVLTREETTSMVRHEYLLIIYSLTLRVFYNLSVLKVTYPFLSIICLLPTYCGVQTRC